jgi:hypothetical protein
MMQKTVSEMTPDELREAAERLQRQQAKRKAYSARRKQSLTPAQKAARLEYGRRKRANDKAILAEAERQGLLADVDDEDVDDVDDDAADDAAAAADETGEEVEAAADEDADADEAEGDEDEAEAEPEPVVIAAPKRPAVPATPPPPPARPAARQAAPPPAPTRRPQPAVQQPVGKPKLRGGVPNVR